MNESFRLEFQILSFWHMLILLLKRIQEFFLKTINIYKILSFNVLYIIVLFLYKFFIKIYNIFYKDIYTYIQIIEEFLFLCL